jgi:type IV secretion system protein VirB9
MISRQAVSLFACAFVALAATRAAAQDDSRVRSLFYDRAAIVAVAGSEGFQSTIQFGDDEKIENVAVGDSLAWQVTPNKRANLLFLKPILANARTNMTVVTDRHVYLFDLLPSSRTAPLLYSLRFTYPDPPKPPPPPIIVPPQFNFDWTAKGAQKLFPAQMFDDGHALYLAWAKGATLPAMFEIGPDGSEGPVNYAMRGETFVIEGMPHQIMLRSGDDKAVLTGAVRTALAAQGTGH